jgi:hypothetical protein
MKPVHSGLSPSCMDDWPPDRSAEGEVIAFYEEGVTCAACLREWARFGMPKHIARLGESRADFLKRTGQS